MSASALNSSLPPKKASADRSNGLSSPLSDTPTPPKPCCSKTVQIALLFFGLCAIAIAITAIVTHFPTAYPTIYGVASGLAFLSIVTIVLSLVCNKAKAKENESASEV